MILYLVRHTKVSLELGVCYGQTDVDVADTFISELSVILQQLSEIEFSALFSSPLLRCKKLAEKIPFNGDIIYDERLKELDFGSWELKKWDEIYRQKESKKWFDNYLQVSCPNGESYDDLLRRVSDFLTDLQKININGNICIITHGGVIGSIISILKKIEPRQVFKTKIDYGDIIRIPFCN